MTALLGLLVSAGVWIFGPGRLFDGGTANTVAAVAVFGGLFLLVFLLIHYAWGIRVWVRRETVLTPLAVQDGVLSFRGLSKHTRGSVASQYITRMAPIQFDGPWWYLWRSFEGLPENAVVYRQPGYVGPGVLVSYRLPPHMVADAEERTWVLPVPRARELMDLLEHTRCTQGDR